MKIHYLILMVFSLSLCEIFPQQEFQIRDTALAAKHFSLGVSLTKAALYDSSNIYFDKAAHIYNSLYDQTQNQSFCEKYISCENKMGWNLMMLGKYDEADDLLNKALSLGLKVLGENNLEVAQCYHVIGVVYWGKEDFLTSIDYHKKALDIRLRLLGEENTQVASTYNNLGIDYNEIEDNDKSLEYYKKALAIDLKKNSDETALAKTYNNIGNVYLHKDDYDKGLEYHQKALSIRLRLLGENNPYTADSYENIGIIYGQKDEYQKALEYFNRSLSIRIHVFGASHPWVAESYNELANCYYYMGVLDTALQYCRKSLDILKNYSGIRNQEILNAYINMGKIYKDKRDFLSASEYFNKALSLSTDLYGEKNLFSGVAYKRLAELNELRHNYNDALASCQKALISLVNSFHDNSINSNPPLTGIVSEIELLNTLSLKARILNELSDSTGIEDLSMSYSTYKLASDLIDQMRTGYKAEGSKIFLGVRSNDVFNSAIRVTLKLYNITDDERYKEEALYFAEKSKAAVLEQSLAEVKAAKFAGIPDDLLEHEKQLKIDLTYYETALQKEYQKKDNRDENKINECQNNLFTLKTQYDDLISDFEKKFPDYFSLKYRKQELSVSEIRNSLKENTALLDYSGDDSLLYIFLITRDDFKVYPVNLPHDFSDLIRNVKSLY
ncbi:MAG TPA: tetratricopeptide repeat protein [Ignavibacteriaceae bacterium]|nr:tetratricopeptide repeat protein [Ignavibacteriaceae bacterium]